MPGILEEDELVLGIPGMLEELDELDELGILGMLDELDELDDDVLGILGELDELDELEELGILGILLDEEELDVLSQPASVITASPSSRPEILPGFCKPDTGDRLVVLIEFIVGLYSTLVGMRNEFFSLCFNIFLNDSGSDFVSGIGNGIVILSLPPSGG